MSNLNALLYPRRNTIPRRFQYQISAIIPRYPCDNPVQDSSTHTPEYRMITSIDSDAPSMFKNPSFSDVLLTNPPLKNPMIRPIHKIQLASSAHAPLQRLYWPHNLLLHLMACKSNQYQYGNAGRLNGTSQPHPTPQNYHARAASQSKPNPSREFFPHSRYGTASTVPPPNEPENTGHCVERGRVVLQPQGNIQSAM